MVEMTGNSDETLSPVLVVRDLHKTYKSGQRRIKALDGLDLQVFPSEIFGFLGPNGAGKTTAIKCIIGLVFPDKGEITLFGKSSSDISTRARIGFLPEEATFADYLTAEETLVFFARIMGIAAIDERVGRVLDLVKLAGCAQALVRTFSRGMKQRLGMAQVLLNNPELLILDEPLSGLDPMGRTMMKEIILGIKKSGKTVFMSSHQLLEIEQVCDRVAILCRGSVVKEKNVSDLNVPHGEPSALEQIFISTVREHEYA